MKTKNATVVPTTVSSLNELIFQNRNHAYGAYELRKKYDKRLIFGFFFAFFIVGSALGYQVIENYLNNNVILNVPKKDVVAEFIDYIVPPPPPPPPPIVPILVRQPYLPPVIVESVEEGDLLLDPTSELIANAQNELPPKEILAHESEIDNHVFDIEPEKERWSVEESATFNGGNINQFRDWVIKNMTYPVEAMNNGIEGKVYIIFAVNSKGKVCNISLKRGVHPSLDEAVIRTVLNSPDWMPAKQNGTPVKQMFSLIVYFKNM
jgi:periplasmic protein TonB